MNLYLPDNSFKITKHRPIQSWLFYYILVAIIVIFAGIQLYNLWRGPIITFDENLNQSGFNYTKDNVIQISGSLKRVAFLYIDNRLQETNADQTFSYDLYTLPGTSIITVRVVDRYGRKKDHPFRVYNPNPILDSERSQRAARDAWTTFTNQRQLFLERQAEEAAKELETETN